MERSKLFVALLFMMVLLISCSSAGSKGAWSSISGRKYEHTITSEPSGAKIYAAPYSALWFNPDEYTKFIGTTPWTGYIQKGYNSYILIKEDFEITEPVDLYSDGSGSGWTVHLYLKPKE